MQKKKDVQDTQKMELYMHSPPLKPHRGPHPK